MLKSTEPEVDLPADTVSATRRHWSRSLIIAGAMAFLLAALGTRLQQLPLCTFAAAAILSGMYLARRKD